MSNIADFEKCSNCGACYNACPTGAIVVKEDGLFYEPTVNNEKCINCGLCKKVCPVNTPEAKQKVVCAYGLVHNDDEILKKSSSGGAFSALAEFVLNNGGVVFGAAYSKDCRTIDFCSTEERPLDDLRRSKYVESKVGYSFRRVKEILSASPERYVLYCGAPCQIAGIKRYLGKEYENLITCDFSCGGFPSHRIYTEYLSLIEKKLRSGICSVNFRPKTYGWENHAIKITAVNKKKYVKPAFSDPFFDCFIGRHVYASVREYCLTCDFANNHYSDIILADLWKYKAISNIRNGNKGISLVITNSEKGEKVVKAITKMVALTVLDIDEATYNFKEKSISENVLKRRANFLSNAKEKGFAEVAKHIKLQSALKFKIKQKIKKIIGKE